MVQIVDGAARSRIAHDLTSRLAVDAGAGSGKTSSLVERIVTLVLEKQVPMASVAAITFTEAAAAELRARIRATLTDQARHQPRLSQAAREVDDAAICTIHAFALRILTENWLEAGLPPQVEVLDPAAEHLEHKRRWREFTDGLLEDDGAAVTLKRAFAAGLRLSQLTDVAQALVDCHDRLTPEVVATLEANRQRLAAPTVDVTGLLGHLREALTHRLTCSDPQDALLGHLGSTTVEAVRRLERLDDANDETAVVSVLCTLPKLSSNRGKQENWGGAINDVREACQAAESAKEAVLSAVRRSVVADYGWRMAVWAVDGAARRRAEGRLTFHDLLVEASRALGTNAELRARVRGRYRCLLIDEYQDTDPLQAELAQLLGSPADDDDTARLFVVGDPEQSIYRFRRADVAQFEKTVTSMDARVWLTSNFRSVPEILGFVDFVFGELHDELAVDGAIGHRRLHPTRPEGSSGAGPAVAVFGGPGGEGLARDVRLQSTTDVAAVVHSIVEEGWSVGAGDAQAPACFRDIAVLLPTRTSLAMLERAFETAEIPYRLEGATLMWASQDVRDVLAVARAVSDPADAVSVLAALRTPALACGDDDLVRFHSAGGSWDPRASRSERFPDGDPVAQAMDVLKAFHDRKMWMDASSLLSSIVADLRFFE
ncbi:MAG: UvrD-helicase domain-containing protein, partial [Acidimicrobiales bacterium]